MIERVQDRFGVWPERLAADTSYGSAEMLAWLVYERDMHPHIAVFDKSVRRDGTFERADFRYGLSDGRYVCPAGNRLRTRNRNFTQVRGDVGQYGFIRYRARQQDCAGCDLRLRCTPNMPARKVTQSIHEGARDLSRDIASTDAYVASRRQRKKVEMPKAHPEDGSIAPARPQRRQRRVPPRSYPEPPQNGQADPDADTDATRLRRRTRLA